MVRSEHQWYRPLLVVGVLAATVALNSCGQQQSEQRTAPTRQGEIVVSGPDVTDSMSAGVSGVLSRVGSCIGLGDSLVIWPHGTTWDPATSTLTFSAPFEGYSAQLGQHVHGGGGTVPLESFQQGAEGWADALVECGARPGDQVHVFGPDTSVEPTFPSPAPAVTPRAGHLLVLHGGRGHRLSAGRSCGASRGVEQVRGAVERRWRSRSTARHPSRKARPVSDTTLEWPTVAGVPSPPGLVLGGYGPSG